MAKKNATNPESKKILDLEKNKVRDDGSICKGHCHAPFLGQRKA